MYIHLPYQKSSRIQFGKNVFYGSFRIVSEATYFLSTTGVGIPPCRVSLDCSFPINKYLKGVPVYKLLYGTGTDNPASRIMFKSIKESGCLFVHHLSYFCTISL